MTDLVSCETVREFVIIIAAQAKAALNGIAKPGYLQMSRLDPDSEKLVPRRYELNDAEDMINDAIADARAGHNVYIEGRTIREDASRNNGRGKREDTRAVFALIVDSDADKQMGWQPNGQASPSMIVATSPGNFQYWYFFRDAVPGDIGDRLGARVRKATACDHDTGTITQPYRVAGTVNFPSKTKRERGRVIVPTYLVQFDPEVLWSPEEIEQAFPLQEQAQPRRDGNGGADEAGIPADTMRVIREGSSSDRSQAFWNVLVVLNRLGFALEAIVSLLERYPNGVAKKYEGRLRQEVERAYNKLHEEKPADTTKPLQFINMTGWTCANAPPRDWAVLDRIPLRQPTLFSGEGAVGKSLIELHLCCAHVLGRDWLGTMPEPGAAIYFGAEDEPGELHRRLADIATYYGVEFSDLISGGLHLLSMAGEDALLGVPDRSGLIVPTPLYGQLLEAVRDIKPIHIGIDTSADVFGGNENDRAQVRQFVGMLRKVAIGGNCSVVLLAHPSLTGINTGSGLSGSTGWHNSVRARMYLRSANPIDGEQPDSDLREMEFKKNNYGPKGESIVLRYKNGVFLPEPGISSLDKIARAAKAEETFLELLKAFNRLGRAVSDKPKATNYAPNAFANGAKQLSETSPGTTDKFTKADFQAAMERLFMAEKIFIEPYGKPSRGFSKISIKEKANG